MSTTLSIKALPQSTVRLIGSTQVLVDPSSVVKELIENGIDAHATSISIEISSNTLDVIQVRDNGHGIAPEDRAIACKRYTTSKIHDFSDLNEIGGTSLGFRGEALHSLAEMSASLTVTTRVDGEAAAVKLIIGRSGDVETRDPASHPVGTTVRATDFFNNLPVRKQTALKATPKCLARIKRIVMAYAMARPNVRFSLRVLKAKNEKGNFIYAPKAGAACVQDAALKVFGKDLALQCKWMVLRSDGYETQVFAPTPDSDPTKFNNIGHYLFIDARPISTSRGVLKTVAGLFKEKLRTSNTKFASVKDPFFYLNILCPKASYDPNVEPAKDDVLFGDSSKMLAAVEELLTSIYPDCNGEREQCDQSLVPLQIENVASQDTCHHAPAPKNQILQGQSPVSLDCDHGCELMVQDDNETDVQEQNTEPNPVWRSSMYGCDEEDLELLADSKSRTRSEESGSQDALEVNPWTIAKLNAPVRPALVTNSASNNLGHERTQSKDHNGIEIHSSSAITTRHKRRDQTFIPSPSRISVNQPRNRPILPPVLHTGQTTLDKYGLLTPHPSSSPVAGTPLDVIPEAPARHSRPRRREIANYSSAQHANERNWFNFKPFTIPTRKPKVSNIQNNRNGDNRCNFATPPQGNFAPSAPIISQGEREEEESNNDAIMLEAFNSRLDDPEPRQQGASSGIDRWLQTIDGPSRGTAAPTAIIGSSRQNDHHEGHGLLENHEGYEPSVPQPPPQRRCTSEGRRSKSSRLPLERIPVADRLQGVALVLCISLNEITKAVARLSTPANPLKWNDAPDQAYDTFACGTTVADVDFWSLTMRDALQAKLKRAEETGDEDVALAIVGALSRWERLDKTAGTTQ